MQQQGIQNKPCSAEAPPGLRFLPADSRASRLAPTCSGYFASGPKRLNLAWVQAEVGVGCAKHSFVVRNHNDRARRVPAADEGWRQPGFCAHHHHTPLVSIDNAVAILDSKGRSSANARECPACCHVTRRRPRAKPSAWGRMARIDARFSRGGTRAWQGAPHLVVRKLDAGLCDDGEQELQLSGGLQPPANLQA